MKLTIGWLFIITLFVGITYSSVLDYSHEFDTEIIDIHGYKLKYVYLITLGISLYLVLTLMNYLKKHYKVVRI